jgi:uncharacterized protein (TIGR00369 family)
MQNEEALAMALKEMTGYDGCFVCDRSGKNPKALGVTIYWNAQKERSEIPFTPEPAWCGFEGIVHGGILAALADDAMSWALKQGIGGFGYTANMSVRYLRPVKLGSSYTAVGNVMNQEDRKVHTRARIMDESGKICVDVKALFVIPEKN